MPTHSGDSTPSFDNIREASDVLNDPFAPKREDSDASADSPTPELSESADSDGPQLGDSHILEDRIMIPHHSDGTTEVIAKGRDEVEPDEEELTERMFAPAAESEENTSSEETREDCSSDNSGEVAPAIETPQLAAVPSTAPVAAPPAPSTSKSGPNLPMILLASYASAVTIALIFVLATRPSGGVRNDQLESLPDPLDQDGKIPIYKRDAELPGGHTLHLKESQRFGNILVEPVKVTQQPLKFRHFSGESKRSQPNSQPVLCLWLKFTNVSSDQEIAPLDGQLLFKRVMNESGNLVANTFVCPTSDSARDSAVLPYPHPPHSEFDLVGQNLGIQLKPGDSVETFIPCDTEGMQSLQGELVWRIHMRKGYAKSGHGVTTLVDVIFHRSEVSS